VKQTLLITSAIRLKLPDQCAVLAVTLTTVFNFHHFLSLIKITARLITSLSRFSSLAINRPHTTRRTWKRPTLPLLLIS
jgi:hypothetical protein